jgi:hypothetical protein
MEVVKNDDKEYQDWLKEVEATPHLRLSKYHKFNGYKIKGGWFIGESLARPLFELRNKTFNSDDIIITSLPKSGTAWMQELVYIIVTLDFQGASENNIHERYDVFGIPTDFKKDQILTETRFHATHLPFSLLPKDIMEKKCKIIHIARNPKDRIVSFYHFMQLLKCASYKGTIRDMFHDLVNDDISYLPYAQHILEYWKKRNDENVLYLTYEALHKDMIGNIKNISEFLGKSLTEEQMQQIAEHCSFNKMALNPATNFSQWDKMGLTNDNKMKYMRKGKVGDWKNYFDEELDKEFQDWYEKNFKDEDIDFEYDI